MGKLFIIWRPLLNLIVRNFFASLTLSRLQEPCDASVLVFDREMSIGYRDAQQQNRTERWLLSDLELSFEPSTQSTRIKHRPDNAELRINGKGALDYLLALQAEREKPWINKKSTRERGRVLLFIGGFVGSLLLLYLLLVPFISEKLAGTVEPETERQLGDAVFEAMALDSAQDSTASILLNEFFAAMEVETPYRIRIMAVRDNTVNAFALPGGRIVVYTGLLEQISSYPELAALLSHEFIHVHNRHATKSIFRKLGSQVFLGLVFGNMGAVTTVLVNHADDLKSLTYSRSLEKEADLEGLTLLLHRKIDPAGFTSLFRHLKAAAPASALPEFLASHPDIDKRIFLIKEAAVSAEVQEDEQLKAIFSRLKQ